jgi:hypothetical protein
MDGLMPDWEQIHQSESEELPLDYGADLLRNTICHLHSPRRDLFTLTELLFHMKDTSLETACLAAMREMEMKKLSWPTLEDHMSNLTFPTIRLLSYQAHGG